MFRILWNLDTQAFVLLVIAVIAMTMMNDEQREIFMIVNFLFQIPMFIFLLFSTFYD